MIHVCSLARLYKTVEETKALHIVTLLRLTDRVTRPAHIAAENHLILAVDDIVDAEEGATVPAQDHIVRLIDFARAWDRSSPMVVPRKLRGEVSSEGVVSPLKNLALGSKNMASDRLLARL